MKVFISYSNLDSTKVDRIIKEVRNENFELVIIATNREALIPLTEKVKKGVKASQVIIPILTSNSMCTQWINQEIGFATALKKRIIPIVESNIMGQLKGFIHPQVDLPYHYNANENEAQENNDFIKCFQQILSDLEAELRQNLKQLETMNRFLEKVNKNS